jgi:hypothetical protein
LEELQDLSRELFASLPKAQSPADFLPCSFFPSDTQFVEDEGEVVFYKDAFGRTSRQVIAADLPSDSGVDVGN